MVTMTLAPGLSFGGSENFERAQVYGVAGEASSLYLVPEGIFLHPQYNDVTGDTDKLLTASFKLGILDRVGSTISYESILFWRLITPVFNASTKSEELEQPIGVYADWMEYKTAIAHSTYIGNWLLKPQISLGFNHIGNKGGKKLHRWIHRVTNNPSTGLEYSGQPRGYFGSGGVIVALAKTLGHWAQQSVSGQVLIGGESSKMLQETFINVTSIWTIRKNWWETAFDLRIVKQEASLVYEGLKPYRYEASAAAAFYRNYTPTIKYISSYLTGDNIGQTYFDFIHINFEF